MTRIEYDLLREELPELNLPKYIWLRDSEIERLPQFTRDGLIAARFAVLIGREPGTTDAVRFLPRPVLPYSPK